MEQESILFLMEISNYFKNLLFIILIFSYYGNWIDGEKNGLGTYTWTNGEK